MQSKKTKKPLPRKEKSLEGLTDIKALYNYKTGEISHPELPSGSGLPLIQQHLISDDHVPTAYPVYNAEVKISDKAIEASVKKEVEEILSKSTEGESLRLLLDVYSKLSKKYKKLKIKKDSLEKIVNNPYINSKIIYGAIDLNPYEDHAGATRLTGLEILADRAGAFKPHKITVFCRRKTQESGIISIDCSVDVLSVEVMGIPQFANYCDLRNKIYKYIDSRFFESGKIVDWAVFGASAGQGLLISLRNQNNFTVSVSIIIEGMAADTSLIGMC